MTGAWAGAGYGWQGSWLVAARAGFWGALATWVGVGSSSPQVPGHPTSMCDAGVNKYYQRLLNTFKKDPKMFQSYTNQFKNHLRLLPTFAGGLREKIRTCAGFNKIPTNYISEESLINGDYDKSIVYAIFLFSKCEEAVRVETTEVRSSEFMGYWIPQH